MLDFIQTPHFDFNKVSQGKEDVGEIFKVNLV